MIGKAYVYGDTITKSEFMKVRRRLAPKAGKRLRRATQDKVVAAMHHLAPNRLEHEVNRLRGIAFDSGEAGFSHVVIH